MKTVMKKIFSLMLVAVLLVSAVPFAASAEETIPLALTPGEQYTVNAAFVAAHYTGSGTPTKYFVHNGGLMGETFTAIAERDYFLIIEEFAAVPQPCATCGKAVHEGTCCATCKEQGHTAAAHCKDCGNVVCTCIDVTCEECGKVECECCEVCHKATCICDDEKPVAHTVRFSVDGNNSYWYLNVLDGYTVKEPGISYMTDWTYLKQVGDTGSRAFLGWSTDKDDDNGDPLEEVVTWTVNGPVTYYAIYKDNINVAPPTGSNGGITNKDNTNKVYLHVYLNGNAGTIAMTKEITDSYLLDDDKTSNGEIWSYLADNYYTAKDSKGMLIDGLYVNTGTFPQNYYTDNKVTELSGIEAMRDQYHVHISVMLKNAVVKSSYSNSNTADSSNPKTGDMILAPVAVLGLSASALAVLFFLNKKRAY